MAVNSLPAMEIGAFSVTAFASVSNASEILIADDRRAYRGALVAINAEKIASNYPSVAKHMSELQDFALFYPDGQPIAWLMRRRGVAARRIPGVELWLALVQRIAPDRRLVYCFGGSPEVNSAVIARLQDILGPDRVHGRHGYDFTLSSIVEDIEKFSPDLVFVALGSPMQERVISELFKIHPACLYMGVGGSFDILAGVTERAPMWMRRRGLEWLFRLVKQPARILRYSALLKFVALVVLRRV